MEVVIAVGGYGQTEVGDENVLKSTEIYYTKVKSLD